MGELVVTGSKIVPLSGPALLARILQEFEKSVIPKYRDCVWQYPEENIKCRI